MRSGKRSEVGKKADLGPGRRSTNTTSTVAEAMTKNTEREANPERARAGTQRSDARN